MNNLLLSVNSVFSNIKTLNIVIQVFGFKSLPIYFVQLISVVVLVKLLILHIVGTLKLKKFQFSYTYPWYVCFEIEYIAYHIF